jgi:hypothetical protein
MRLLKLFQEWGGKGERWSWWTHLWYIVRTFVNVTMYPSTMIWWWWWWQGGDGNILMKYVNFQIQMTGKQRYEQLSEGREELIRTLIKLTDFLIVFHPGRNRDCLWERVCEGGRWRLGIFSCLGKKGPSRERKILWNQSLASTFPPVLFTMSEL